MPPDELAELIDLHLDDALPDALRAWVEAHLAADPAAMRDRETLHQTLQAFRALPAERPDDWFTERCLDGVLREYALGDPALLKNTLRR